jgi:2Fe-2S ferredoxin
MAKITFLPMNKTVEFDPSDAPFGDVGEAGSILDIALENGVEIEHSCHGYAACGTCHVIVKEGMENLSDLEDEEMDMLEGTVGHTLQSRLACQAVVKGDVVVEIPE